MSSGRRKRVAPQGSSVTVEIRPSRHLRIQHFNPRPRDAKFENEMQMFLQYRQQGVQSSGPLTMPRRLLNNVDLKGSGSECDSLPHSTIKQNSDNSNNTQTVIGEPLISPVSGKQQTLTKELEDSAGLASQSSSLFSTPTHTSVVNENVRSASSVQVALHAKQAQQQKEEQCLFKKVQSNLPENIEETEGENLHLDLLPINKEQDIVTKSFTNPNSLLLEQDLANPTADQHLNQGHTIETQKNNGLLSNKENAGDISSVRAVDTDTVIFFIHGVGGSSDVWFAQLLHFSNLGYEVVAPDLIGHGFSCTPKQPKAYHFKEIAADLEELFDKYCKRKNVLVGHSYGASFVTFIARNRPRRVSKLVLISGGPPSPLEPQPGVFTLPTCMLGCIHPCLRCGFYRGAFHKKRKPVLSKRAAFNIPTYVLQNTMNGQKWPDGDELYHNWLTTPCLLIYGAQDQLVSLEEEEHMAEAIYGSRLEVIQDASHMVMIEAPDEVNQLIEDFIHQTASSQAPPPTTNRNSNNELHSGKHHDTRQHPPYPRSKSRMSLKSAKLHKGLPNKSSTKS